MVKVNCVKWDKNPDLTKLSTADRKKYHAAMQQHNIRQKKLNDPQLKEGYVDKH